MQILGVLVALLIVAQMGGLFSLIFEPEELGNANYHIGYSSTQNRCQLNYDPDDEPGTRVSFNPGWTDMEIKSMSLNRWYIWSYVEGNTNSCRSRDTPGLWFYGYQIMPDTSLRLSNTQGEVQNYAQSQWNERGIAEQELNPSDSYRCYTDLTFNTATKPTTPVIYPNGGFVEDKLYLRYSDDAGSTSGITDNCGRMSFTWGEPTGQQITDRNSFWQNLPDIDLSIQDKGSIFVKEFHRMPITITNNERPFKATLTSRFTFNTPTGEVKERVNENVTIQVGVNEFEVLVPTSDVGTVFVESELGMIWAPDTKRESLIAIPDTANHTYLVSPLPIYLPIPEDGNCESMDGYSTPNQPSGYCIRNDLLELTCTQIGCPVLDFPNGTTVAYQCGSTGLCSQTIGAAGCQEDSECRTDEVCEFNPQGTGFCTPAPIREIAQVLPEPEELRLSCEELSFENVDGFCAEGFECIDVTVNEKEIASCQRPPPGIFDIPLWLVALVGIAIIIAALQFGKKTRKRRRRGK